MPGCYWNGETFHCSCGGLVLCPNFPRRSSQRIKHQVGDVWRDRRAWKVQMPKGILTCRTKRDAMRFAESVSDLVNEVKSYQEAAS
jgi:hypothetical protein